MAINIQAIRNYNRVKAKIAELEKELDTHKAAIIDSMGGQEEVSVSVSGLSVVVTNKVVTTTRIDTKKARAAYPDIMQTCGTTTSGPRFTVKLKG